ncbi:MAG: CBS domain-containing protein, partial [Halieaceae bacterium]|nr:CBS domain-containing protein [Halieaceae bacterium]
MSDKISTQHVHDREQANHIDALGTPERVTDAEFIRQTLPFNELPASILYPCVAKILVHYHCRGESFSADTPDKGLRIIRSGAVELRDSDNKLLDRLGEGESFHIIGLNAERGAVIATVIEDALVYFVPDDVYRGLRKNDRSFDRYFSGQRNRRLRRAARYQPEPNTMMQQVNTLMSTNLLMMEPSATVQETAQAMAKRRVSSAFVVKNTELLGIVTDRDLRVRAVAKALAPETPVSQVMTANPEWVEGQETIFAATLLMTQ